MAAIVTSILITSIKQQVESSTNREQKTGVLLETSRSLLRSTGKKTIINTGLDHLAKLFNWWKSRSISKWKSKENS